MRFFEKTAKCICVMAMVACLVAWTFILSCNSKTASSYYTSENESIEGFGAARLCPDSGCIPGSAADINKSRSMKLKLFGLIPVKQVTVTLTEQKMVVPGGIPFGVKLISDGVMVSSTTSIKVNDAYVSPARDAGIGSTDAILRINGKTVRSNLDVIEAVNKSEGKTVEVMLRRQNNKTETVKVRPAFDSTSKSYKMGVIIKDSSAGIGTITFYDPQNATFGGLGHAVCDADSGSRLSLLKGEVVMAQVDSVTKGSSGSPGFLSGRFVGDFDCGTVLVNDATGVYGTLRNVNVTGSPVAVAFKQEVKLGRASILTTVSGRSAKQYEIEIEKIAYNENRAVKNMVICVTDKELLSQTGGIVQGMSGSPILQNGKLVGAVTHVFVNDFTRGYAIFAENMISAASFAESSDALSFIEKAS